MPPLLNCEGPSQPVHTVWPRGYKTIFMLTSAEHEICPANYSQIQQ